ncbi:MAG: S8 family serine peptidase [Sulfurimonas sp.]|nr:S8 family serine peptidase [Sulfurimonas sp.]
MRKDLTTKKIAKISITEAEVNGKIVQFRSNRLVIKLKGKKNLKNYDFLKNSCKDICKIISKSKVLRYPKKTSLLLLEVPKNSNILKLAEEMSKRDDVDFAEPDYIGRINIIPNDSKYSDQWAPQKTNSQGAWDLETGSSNILIAIIDSGIATANDGSLNHPDLDNATRYILGTDFISNDALPRDDNSHGTHVAGIAAAQGNNTQGIAGVNWNSPVYICKVADSLGNVSQADVQAAVEEVVDYAINNNLQVVINLSLVWQDAHSLLENAVEYAHDNGMIICIAAGNEDWGPVLFPAAYSDNFSSIIAVGSTNKDDYISDFTSVGPEVTVVAPGSDILSTMPTYDVTSTDLGASKNYDEMSGTSMASPFVAGLASLVWSKEPLQNSEQVKDVIINTAVKLGPSDFNNAWGYGRVDAQEAVAKAGWDIELSNLSLNFMDIPENETTARAIKFDVKSFHETSFEIIDGPTGVFEISFEGSTSLSKSSDYNTVRNAYIWISYTGGNAGNLHGGIVEVRCIQTQETWKLHITANTIKKPSSCVMMVLDQSDSMRFESGVEDKTRMDVLKYSANILTDFIQEGNAIGIVSFDEDAHNILIPVVGPLNAPSGIDFDRSNIRNSIASFSHNPDGYTSIGDGIKRGYEQLNNVVGYENKALLVLTDGKENRSQYISDIIDVIDEKVFAVGLGTAAKIDPNALTKISNGTGGYTLLTDELNNDSYFKLAKYFLQILAGITNEDIVVDPNGWLQEGEIHKIPFNLTSSDISSDIILLIPYNDLIEFYLEAPDGTIVDASFATVHLHQGQNIKFYRVSFPVATSSSSGLHEGKWHAVLKVNTGYFKEYLASLDKYSHRYETAKKHGVQYTLLVHAYSNLRMKATLSQNSHEIGANIHLRVVLSEYGVSIRKSASVKAELTYPDNSSSTIYFNKIEQGIYEADCIADLSGVYKFRIMADGNTYRQNRYTREQVLTGTIYRGGDKTPPSSKDTPHNSTEENFCKLISCLDKNMNKKLHERLKSYGINLEGLKKCFCKKSKKKKLTTTLENLKISDFLNLLKLK